MKLLFCAHIHEIHQIMQKYLIFWSDFSFIWKENEKLNIIFMFEILVCGSFLKTFSFISGIEIK